MTLPAPYYEDEWCTIYHADCRDLLPSLAVVAEMVLTDVPYNVVNRDDYGLRSLDRGPADSAPFDSLSFLDVIARSAVKSVYAWCGTEQVSALRGGLAEAGATTRLGIWHKTNPSPMNGEYLWLSSIETCVFGRFRDATFHEFCESPVWTGPTAPIDEHPTAKPEWLFRRLVKASSSPGDIVLDPYMGSGTTLRVAKDEGRRSIGIEISEAYCEIAVRRLAQEVLPFA